MKRRLTLAIAALAAFGLIAGFATNATAFPTKTTACSGCHSGPALTVAATQTSNDGVTAAYNVTAPGAYYIAVFDGTAKVAQITGASGTAALTVGHTYTLRAVEGPTTSSGYGQLVVTPLPPIVTPPTDTVAPVTTSDALSTYVSSAAIHLTATDNAGGSGVAATYYVLDGGSQTAGTLVNVSALGSHTLKFWSVDVAGNVEAQKTAAFTVTSPVITPTPTPTPDPSDDPTPTPIPSGISKVTVHVMGTNSHDLRGATVTLVNTTTGATFTVKTDRHGNAVITGVPFGRYTVTATAGRALATGKLTISKSRTKLSLRVHNVRSMHRD